MTFIFYFISYFPYLDLTSSEHLLLLLSTTPHEVRRNQNKKLKYAKKFLEEFCDKKGGTSLPSI